MLSSIFLASYCERPTCQTSDLGFGAVSFDDASFGYEGMHQVLSNQVLSNLWRNIVNDCSLILRGTKSDFRLRSNRYQRWLMLQ